MWAPQVQKQQVYSTKHNHSSGIGNKSKGRENCVTAEAITLEADLLKLDFEAHSKEMTEMHYQLLKKASQHQDRCSSKICLINRP